MGEVIAAMKAYDIISVAQGIASGSSKVRRVLPENSEMLDSATTASTRAVVVSPVRRRRILRSSSRIARFTAAPRAR